MGASLENCNPKNLEKSSYLLLHEGVISTIPLLGVPCVQELPANNLLQVAVWPISTFHVGPDQSDLRPDFFFFFFLNPPADGQK